MIMIVNVVIIIMIHLNLWIHIKIERSRILQHLQQTGSQKD